MEYKECPFCKAQISIYSKYCSYCDHMLSESDEGTSHTYEPPTPAPTEMVSPPQSPYQQQGNAFPPQNPYQQQGNAFPPQSPYQQQGNAFPPQSPYQQQQDTAFQQQTISSPIKEEFSSISSAYSPSESDFDLGLDDFHIADNYREAQKLSSLKKTSGPRIEGYLHRDLRAFIGKKANTYLRKFEKIDSHKMSFNWCAFLFSGYWLAYRKMLAASTIFWIIYFSFVIGYTTLLQYLMDIHQLTLSSAMGMSVMRYSFLILQTILMGFLGDRIYWRHTKKSLNRFHCQNNSEIHSEKNVSYIKDDGGTSKSFAFLAIIICIGINILLSVLFNETTMQLKKYVYQLLG
ncbi:proline-rich domain-containing protein [Anaeromicropila populeti]|uniref:DUF2628 domain-containing protein n=1 Tax=Anaeromicropila populeti TaxID=37658 RepID=A0A1I6HKW5_9FIRM|nr:proline-rich domain-containing protein [Anaeromicropila populeti]SFR55101.1 Protein of unknown function [Anaeromicropila populeti]